MRAREIKKGIYWVGAIDWNLRNFHGYLTQKGSTYNAYLIIDEKITLVDTVKHYLFEEMLERIKTVVDPARIEYIISNHVEMDHSGSLPKILKIAKNAKVVTSPNGEKGLKAHFKQDFNFQIVNTLDKLNTGTREFEFVLTPMVHWPDSMVTYVRQDKLLFSNDAFGQHIASSQRFDDEVGFDIARSEAAKYYANIVLPYANQVKKALADLSGLDIDLIAPSHGIIWRSHLKEIVGLYKNWADNQTDEKAMIVYDSMWHSTEKISGVIGEAFDSLDLQVNFFNLQTNHISDIMAELLSAKYICVGSPTLNNNMLPTVAAFLTYMKGLAPKKRIGLAFGSYGWGGQSIVQIEEVLKGCGFSTLENIKVKYIPDKDTFSAIKDKIKAQLRSNPKA
ncbi:MAG: FprA family A-type flavoprotein [Candidatus Omnitrophica bacterium]|nr:FprA family A-type flavoprotein [Candidatus Omnitrophota bacterium]